MFYQFKPNKITSMVLPVYNNASKSHDIISIIKHVKCWHYIMWDITGTQTRG